MLSFLFLWSMIVFYNLSVRFYSFLIWLLAPFNKKAANFKAGRKGLLSRLAKEIEGNSSPIVWFHAASLGEFEQGLPVMQAYKTAYPNYKLLVTFFSPSGYEERKNHPVADFVYYLPVDGASNAKRFLDIVRPTQVFFIKYEYWYHYLNEVNKRGIPLYSLSALFTQHHVFFKPYGGFYRNMLKLFNHTFVQNESSLKLIKDLGINECSVSGDTRFDRVLKTVANPSDFPNIEKFKGDNLLMVIGSAWSSDMQVLNDFINASPSHLKFIIAPHLIDKGSVNKITLGVKGSTHLYSESEIIPEDTKILVLDTMGMLSSVYQYGDLAYIGGAFGDGLHNILEAVAFGLPVVFGNKGLEKFPESLELKKLNGAFSIKSAHEASDILRKMTEDDSFRLETAEICKKYVSDNAGATDRIMDYLRKEVL